MIRFTPKGYMTLTLLVVVALFLIGVETGKSIQKIDNEHVSIPATTPAESLDSTSSVQFDTVNECGVSFLLPAGFNKTRSKPPRYTMENEFIEIDCQNLLQFDKKSLISSGSTTIAQRKTTIFKLQDALVWTLEADAESKKPSSSAELLNQSVTFRSSQNISKLVQRTLLRLPEAHPTIVSPSITTSFTPASSQ